MHNKQYKKVPIIVIGTFYIYLPYFSNPFSYNLIEIINIKATTTNSNRRSPRVKSLTSVTGMCAIYIAGIRVYINTFNTPVNISFVQIASMTGYSERQIRRFSLEIENKDIDSMLLHASKGQTPNNSASDSEINFLKEFKKQYPCISIAQFMDIYHEDIIWNPSMSEIVKLNNLKLRSYSFFKNFFHSNGYESPKNIGVLKLKILILYESLHLNVVFSL